jgi:hypothetical protein
MSSSKICLSQFMMKREMNSNFYPYTSALLLVRFHKRREYRTKANITDS